MTTEWIITTVSLCLTAIMSLSSIIVPCIITVAERKSKRKEQERDLINQAIDKLTTGYGEYKTNSYHILHLLSAIFNMMIYCSTPTQLKLQALSNQLSNHSPYEDTDKTFYECINSLRQEFNFKKYSKNK